MRIRFLLLCSVLLVLNGCRQQKSVFKYQEAMIPMRDGVRLQTVILTPVSQRGPLPILFRRTPYGVPDKAPEQISASFKELAQDGYIFVIQNLRGRFKSEGKFNLSSYVDVNDPKATNETTDAYDSIEWLVKNVPTTG
jgi:putative CocE/NonD family hydrolase